MSALDILMTFEIIRVQIQSPVNRPYYNVGHGLSLSMRSLVNNPLGRLFNSLYTEFLTFMDYSGKKNVFFAAYSNLNFSAVFGLTRLTRSCPMSCSRSVLDEQSPTLFCNVITAL